MYPKKRGMGNPLHIKRLETELISPFSNIVYSNLFFVFAYIQYRYIRKDKKYLSYLYLTQSHKK